MKAKIISLGIVLGLGINLAFAKEPAEGQRGTETNAVNTQALPKEGTETLEAQALIEMDTKAEMEEKEIAKMMEKMKSKSTDSLIDMLSKEIEKKEIKKDVGREDKN
jgi:hypothetical protein